MDNSKTSQVLAFLKKGKKLSPALAFSRFGLLTLSQRIGEIKRRGHNVKDEWVIKGNRRQYKRYFI